MTTALHARYEPENSVYNEYKRYKQYNMYNTYNVYGKYNLLGLRLHFEFHSTENVGDHMENVFVEHEYLLDN